MRWFRFNIWKPKQSLLPAVMEPIAVKAEVIPSIQQLEELGKRVAKKLLDGWLPLETWSPHKGEIFGGDYRVLETDDEMDYSIYTFDYQGRPIFTLFRGSFNRFSLSPCDMGINTPVDPIDIVKMMFKVLTACELHFDKLAEAKEQAQRKAEEQLVKDIKNLGK